MVYVPVFGYRQAHSVGRGGARESRAFVAIAVVTLAAAFCLCYYAYARMLYMSTITLSQRLLPRDSSPI